VVFDPTQKSAYKQPTMSLQTDADLSAEDESTYTAHTWPEANQQVTTDDVSFVSS